MKTLFHGSGDIYRAMAAQILGKSSLNDVTLEERNKAKVICLGYCYHDRMFFYGVPYPVLHIFFIYLTLLTISTHHILLKRPIIFNILLISGTIYGMGPALAASKLGIDVASANRITNAFFNKYKDMRLWMMKIKKLVCK